MEAVAEYDFVATEPEELSFERFDILKILEMTDPYWYKAEMGGREGFVPFNYIRLRLHHWYHANLSRQDAEAMLKASDPVYGTNFLIRTSQSQPGDFSISVIYGTDTVRHLRVNRDVEFGMYFIWSKRFISLNAMVEFYKSTKPILSGENVFLKEAASQITHCEALYNYVAKKKYELTICRGEIVTVIDSSSLWWEGMIGGRRGIFPSNYVLPCAPPKARIDGEEATEAEVENIRNHIWDYKGHTL